MIAVHGEKIEGGKLHLVVVLSACSALKSLMPSTPGMTASPSIRKRFCRVFSAASAIQG
ncbi:hypothetical protein [Bradyrhizobium sp. 1(2017)]|uniref:hypothetical protein n=1 Tax=Bradyrhizobium sp. 1(2017) TaxID=1404888 RepID=UPI00140F3924|nr:hypothetical protein [Bradyrhizobium sp. 1(2017)]QIO32390.1 hypothetical protein HAP40_11435 [Bradyrhizobium sp. 1(2017)]